VVAGPERPTLRPVTFRLEWPLHGGPVAGIASGLEAVSTPVTALLAVDMPWAGELLEHLIAEFGGCAAAALVPVDPPDSGSRSARFSVPGATQCLGSARRPEGRSLRDLVSLVDVQERPLRKAEMGWVQDIGTQADLGQARASQAQPAVVTPMLRAEQSTHNELTSPPTMNKEPAHKARLDTCHMPELNLPDDINVDVIPGHRGPASRQRRVRLIRVDRDGCPQCW